MTCCTLYITFQISTVAVLDIAYSGFNRLAVTHKTERLTVLAKSKLLWQRRKIVISLIKC